jgi:GT2 family glycosyltransferase
MNASINEITVTIVLYKEKISIISRCLENIKNFKIVIVDNAGDHSLKKKIEKKFQIHKYILNKKNYGVTIAANQAIKQCDTEYILIFQADGLISNKDISTLLESHKKYENCFITAPTYYDKESKLSYNGGCLPEKNLGMDVALNLEGDVCVESILDAAILLKKKDIIGLGLYDENFFLYYSDNDLCRRILKTKKSIIQIFEAKAQHDHGEIKVKNFLKKIFIRNYHFTYDELYYYFKVNKYHEKFNYLKKKLPNYIIKSITNLLFFRISQFVYYFAKVVAFYNFKKLLNKKK